MTSRYGVGSEVRVRRGVCTDGVGVHDGACFETDANKEAYMSGWISVISVLALSVVVVAVAASGARRRSRPRREGGYVKRRAA
jgi:hypothetical protein